ncbi:MAG: hypothetical protein A4S09_03565 [Proteobacteria bacterium SG_bin7]|nr:MAG: hypothetical protein A4S09_03565 [Proteobacteria bacterium SG_bin7]
MKKITFFVFIFLSAHASEQLSCLPCNLGLQVCFSDPTDTESAFQRKCEGMRCSECLPSGFGRQRFSYSIFDADKNFVWLGFSNFYTNLSKCEGERRVDLRCN